MGNEQKKTEDKVLFLPLYELGSEIKEEIEASIGQWNRIGSNLSPIFFTRNLRRFIIWLRVCYPLESYYHFNPVDFLL